MDFWLYSFHLLRIQPSGLFGGEFPSYTSTIQPHIYTTIQPTHIHQNRFVPNPNKPMVIKSLLVSLQSRAFLMGKA